MNAPTRAADLAQLSVELIPLTAIAPSETHIQALRRGRFTKEGLKDLAESIAKLGGVLQPIVVRPLIQPRGTAKYELVAGERRWLATKQAGLAHIAASVRPLTEEQVLEVQLIENLQREGLHELEEAEGYDELMKLKKISADQLVDMVGKSRSYIYARLKLLALCAEARKAFYAGELDASRALLIARIGHHDTQRQALKQVGGKQWNGEAMSYREAATVVQRDFMLRLVEAPFNANDATLIAKAGSCAACPKRTGNQPELFPDVKSADVCTDPKCFAEKREAHIARVKAAALKKGQSVIDGKDAKALFPHSYSKDHVAGGYVAAASVCWDDPKHRKVKDIVDADAIELAVNPHTSGLVEVVRTTTLTQALNAKGTKTAGQKAAADRQQHASQKQDTDELFDAIEAAQIGALVAAAPPKIGKPELLIMLRRQRDDYDWESDPALALALGGNRDAPAKEVTKLLQKASDAHLSRAFLVGYVMQAVRSYSDGEAREVAKLWKVDLDKVEKQVREAEGKKSTTEPTAAKAKAPKKGKAKASAKKKPAAKAKGKKK